MRPSGLLLLGLTTGVAGCSALDDTAKARVSTTASAIINGSTDTTRPEVLLLQDDAVSGFRCTATLIAPNLVVTARHCVGKRSTGTTLCKGGPTDEGASALPNYAGDVAAAPMYFSAKPGAPILARAATVYNDGSTTACAHDIALIGLDRAIEDITPAQLRRTELAVGDALVVMGFGWTDRAASVNATERMKGLTNVLALGPTVYAFKPLGDTNAASQPLAIATGEVATNGITMTGDSGGPAFDATGQLAALVSRGYSDALYGPGTVTSIAAHLATIDMALAATGNVPDEDDAGVEPPGPKADAGSAGDAQASGPAADASDTLATTSSSGGCTVTRAGSSDGGGGLDFGSAGALAVAALFAAARRGRRAIR